MIYQPALVDEFHHEGGDGFGFHVSSAAADDARRYVDLDLVTVLYEIVDVGLQEREALVEGVAVEYPGECLRDDKGYAERGDGERRVFPR